MQGVQLRGRRCQLDVEAETPKHVEGVSGLVVHGRVTIETWGQGMSEQRLGEGLVIRNVPPPALPWAPLLVTTPPRSPFQPLFPPFGLKGQALETPGKRREGDRVTWMSWRTGETGGERGKGEYLRGSDLGPGRGTWWPTVTGPEVHSLSGAKERD